MQGAQAERGFQGAQAGQDVQGAQAGQGVQGAQAAHQAQQIVWVVTPAGTIYEHNEFSYHKDNRSTLLHTIFRCSISLLCNAIIKIDEQGFRLEGNHEHASYPFLVRRHLLINEMLRRFANPIEGKASNNEIFEAVCDL